MNADLMLEVARQRMSERQAAAGRWAAVRAGRAAARQARASKRERGAACASSVPDFADELAAEARTRVPAPREPVSSGGRTRADR